MTPHSGSSSTAIEDAAADGSEIAIVQLNSPGAIGSLELLEEAAAHPRRSAATSRGMAWSGAGSRRRWRRPVAWLRPWRWQRPPGLVSRTGTRPLPAPTPTLLPPPGRTRVPLHGRSGGPRNWSIVWHRPIRQLIQDLDGETFVVDGQELIVSTITEAAGGGGHHHRPRHLHPARLAAPVPSPGRSARGDLLLPRDRPHRRRLRVLCDRPGSGGGRGRARSASWLPSVCRFSRSTGGRSPELWRRCGC